MHSAIRDNNDRTVTLFEMTVLTDLAVCGEMSTPPSNPRGPASSTRTVDLSTIRAVQAPDECTVAFGASLGMKNIGKPCTGKPYARFDEGGLATVIRVTLLRHRQTK